MYTNKFFSKGESNKNKDITLVNECLQLLELMSNYEPTQDKTMYVKTIKNLTQLVDKEDPLNLAMAMPSGSNKNNIIQCTMIQFMFGFISQYEYLRVSELLTLKIEPEEAGKLIADTLNMVALLWNKLPHKMQLADTEKAFTLSVPKFVDFRGKTLEDLSIIYTDQQTELRSHIPEKVKYYLFVNSEEQDKQERIKWWGKHLSDPKNLEELQFNFQEKWITRTLRQVSVASSCFKDFDVLLTFQKDAVKKIQHKAPILFSCIIGDHDILKQIKLNNENNCTLFDIVKNFVNLSESWNGNYLHYCMANTHDASVLPFTLKKHYKDAEENTRQLLQYYESLSKKKDETVEIHFMKKALCHRDKEGKTPLLLASKMVNMNWALQLLALDREKKTISLADDKGRTPLHYAYLYGMRKLVCALIMAGADTEAKDQNGKTPRDNLELEFQDKVKAIKAGLNEVNLFYGHYFSIEERGVICSKLLSANNELNNNPEEYYLTTLGKNVLDVLEEIDRLTF